MKISLGWKKNGAECILVVNEPKVLDSFPRFQTKTLEHLIQLLKIPLPEKLPDLFIKKQTSYPFEYKLSLFNGSEVFELQPTLFHTLDVDSEQESVTEIHFNKERLKATLNSAIATMNEKKPYLDFWEKF